jgi:hypothetical protein
MRATELAPEDPNPWLVQAFAWRHLGRTIESNAALSRARALIDEQPRDTPQPKLYTAGNLLNRLDQFQMAAEANAARFGFPLRAVGTPECFIDLSPYYNASLTEDWLGIPGWNYRALPRGLQALGTTRFDVRGLVQVGMPNPQAPEHFPPQVKGIRVHQSARRVHFLHATVPAYGLDRGFKVGDYRVHFSNGKEVDIPLVLGDNIESVDRADPPPKDASIAWGYSEFRGYLAMTSPRLFYDLAWKCPFPGAEVESIDLIANSPAAPLLAAITLEKEAPPTFQEQP